MQKKAICIHCDETKSLVKNGRTLSHNQRMLCKSCGKTFVIESKRNGIITKAFAVYQYLKGIAVCQIADQFDVDRHTVNAWVKQIDVEI
ncbi:MAG: hypothetical protein LBU60_05675 [Clostridiales bacterium]|jgi:transposase-like protein|nr:hypothetical protein [Clostridiales bacterium]